ncbi:DUF3168 domain-containing protein [uncultured Tateyamaria sp.]|uniref:DUF3168 domain-containing protein n=1 Tax=Tateyamaria sp. 1078 TaxID=3417464 RepID=UPI002617938C|nr:DUF3168 domain-containing protein [uncultured Tateyamaria sp.]
MSYAMSAALQEAVFTALSAHGDLHGAVGTAIFDAMPSGAVPTLYVALGPEQVRIADDKTGSGAEHVFVVSVVTEAPGFASAKTAAGLVCDALHEAPLVLSRGRLVSLRFRSAKAAKIEKGTGRKIDLTFRARVEDD